MFLVEWAWDHDPTHICATRYDNESRANAFVELLQGMKHISFIVVTQW